MGWFMIGIPIIIMAVAGEDMGAMFFGGELFMIVLVALSQGNKT